jgi:hypothetical protein
MSFGFGFALPAYPLRGGGGNNPFNQLGPTLDLSFAGVVTDQSDPNGYTLNTNFIIPQYQIAAQYVVWETGVGLVDKTFSQIITFTRASTGTFFSSAGVLTSAAIDAPRLDYNPSTLAAQGLLIEEARTNSIRNNTMVGAVAGTPGTLPTTWTTVLFGLTQTVVGTGTSNGVTYIDIRVNGTTTSAGTIQIKPDGNASGAITATSSQTWAMSSWIAIVGGSATNTTAQRLLINEYSAGPTYLRTAVPATNILAGGATLTRVSGAITTGASTTILEPIIGLDAASGVAIDITLRIGLPQLELGAFATSVIPTTTTALTRAADLASVNTLSPWYNASEGTLYAEYSIPFALTAGASPRLATLIGAGGAAVDELPLFISQVSGKAASANAFTGGVNAGRIDALVSFTANTATKATYAYASNDRSVTTSGSSPTISTAAYTIPTVTTLRLGQDGGGTNNINGYLRRITYYPRRLSNAELQSLTV